MSRGDRFPDLTAELWLVDRLGPRAVFWPFAGVTTGPQRREKIRYRILDLGCENRRAGYNGDMPETFAELFERMYGTPLFPTRNEKETPCEN